MLAAGNTTGANDIEVTAAQKVQFRDAAIYINSSVDGQLDIVADTEIQIAATTIDINGSINASGEIIAASLDISGDIDVDGTANLDVVDIDGAVDFASTTAHAGNATFADNAKAIFGAGSDLQIYHDGSNSYVQDAGTGNLFLQGTELQLRANNSMRYLTAVQAAEVKLYYNNAEKLASSASGISVTGTVTADGLTVSPSGTQQVLATLRANSGAGGGLVVQTDASDDGLIRGYDSSGAVQLQFDTDGGDNYIAKGNVGIGTSSPSGKLEVKGSGTSPIVYFGNGVDNAPNRQLAFSGGSSGLVWDLDATGASSVGGQLTLSTNGTEAMRIDASGNLLVGKTSNAIAAAGAKLGTGGSNFTRSGAEVVYFNRTTNDGAIATFGKDGTTVGSIGVDSGDNLYIGGSAASHSGLYFGTNTAAPITAGTLTDAVTDLGTAGYRFKDLYLSGGVYLGGTGAANLLEDYEEGDHTTSITCTTSGTVTVNTTFDSVSYIKIGQLVTVTGLVVVGSVSSPVGAFKISMPFAVAGAGVAKRGSDSAAAITVHNGVSANSSDYVSIAASNESDLTIYLGDNPDVQTDSAQQLQTGTEIYFHITYRTA